MVLMLCMILEALIDVGDWSFVLVLNVFKLLIETGRKSYSEPYYVDFYKTVIIQVSPNFISGLILDRGD